MTHSTHPKNLSIFRARSARTTFPVTLKSGGDTPPNPPVQISTTRLPLTAEGFKKLELVLLLAALAFLCFAIDCGVFAAAGGLRSPDALASEGTHPVLCAPTGQRKRLLGGNGNRVATNTPCLPTQSVPTSRLAANRSGLCATHQSSQPKRLNTIGSEPTTPQLSPGGSP